MSWIPELPGTEGLEILDDGTMRFSGLRAQGRTYHIVPDESNPAFIFDLKPTKLRITFAVRLDHRITSAYKLEGSPAALPTGAASTNDADVIDDGSVRRQYYAQAGNTYQRWLRRNAWPKAASVLLPNGSPTPKEEDKLGSGGGVGGGALRDDTDLLNHHAQRKLFDVGRVGGGGSTLPLKGLCVSYNPGDGIESLEGGESGSVRVGKCAREIVLHCGLDTQRTDLVLG